MGRIVDMKLSLILSVIRDCGYGAESLVLSVKYLAFKWFSKNKKCVVWKEEIKREREKKKKLEKYPLVNLQ